MKKIKNTLGVSIIILLMILCPIIFLGTIKNSVNAIENKYKEFIYIDPGHGGIDGGGMSDTGIYEKNINLSISYYLKTYLENCGYNVLLTRCQDYDLASRNSKNRKTEDITKRVQKINETNTILYISIHCNIFGDNTIHGAQTFYKQTEENKLLAQAIQHKMKTILKNTTREAKSIEGKYLVDNVTKVGCLVEVGFLSNKEELNLLVDESYQEKVAYCIFIGIIEYLGVNN